MPALKLVGRVDLLALHRLNPSRYPFLMQSAAFEIKRGRFDVLAAFPQEGVVLHHDGGVSTLEGATLEGHFGDILDQRWQQAAGSVDDSLNALNLPFIGGWALYLSYEYAQIVEPVLSLPVSDFSAPVALALRCPVAVVVDALEEVTWLVVEPAHADLLTLLQHDVLAIQTLAAEEESLPLLTAVSEAEDEGFLSIVRQAREYIAAGDVFQINLSRRWTLTFESNVAASAVYSALRIANPAPFAGLFAWNQWAVVSSSPERLVSVQGDVVETRPIAGTRPRQAGDDEQGRIRELIGHPKERAEHIMLIDLERNDLGRVSRPATVEVDELMTVESYAHVHHIVSNVRGRLREGVTPSEILRAVFPGGTITGCPKVRCMQLIAALEQEGRGAYTGSFGYLGHDGRMDLNILIRTLMVEGNQVTFRAGAGIVADSIPEAELAETRAKARGLLRAFGLDG